MKDITDYLPEEITEESRYALNCNTVRKEGLVFWNRIPYMYEAICRADSVDEIDNIIASTVLPELEEAAEVLDQVDNEIRRLTLHRDRIEAVMNALMENNGALEAMKADRCEELAHRQLGIMLLLRKETYMAKNATGERERKTVINIYRYRYEVGSNRRELYPGKEELPLGIYVVVPFEDRRKGLPEVLMNTAYDKIEDPDNLISRPAARRLKEAGKPAPDVEDQARW